MEFTAQQIAAILQGTVEGDDQVKVSNFSKIEEGTPGTLSFLANPKYEKYIYTTEASIVIINNEQVLSQPVNTTLIRVENAYSSMATLMQMVSNLQNEIAKGIDKQAYVHPTAKIGEGVSIAPLAYIGENAMIGDNAIIYPHVFVGKNAKVGSNSLLYSGVKLYYNCEIGTDCILHAGVVIGSDGFGFAPTSVDYTKIPQLGNVIIGNHVEIGANTTVDRAMMGSTKIGNGVKLDNLVQIGHNVEVGDHTVMCAQSGIAGSTKVGKYCMIAGQVGIAGHLNLTDEVKIGAQSGLNHSITEKGAALLGTPAEPIIKARKLYVITKNLPELRAKIFELEREMKEMRSLLADKNNK